ncbi:tail fiber assembly protein [Enterobacter sp. 725m/11]|uniref:tail fiber assembly protein n=1 Tax=Enterobacter sp. 725m/11 TaxID=2717853 RepID=UPI001419A5D9|nr:tail fiber assembly protein [Enterobacter sp. 725m/11]NIB50690.1 tail fiber assembly protein [Enterobacter sp. 725m/11]
MSQAELNSELIAIVAGDITVFNYDGETHEYISSSVEFLPVGVGIPANSCADAPGKTIKGFAIRRATGGKAWEYVADHRGETVYSTQTGEKVVITAPGDYPPETTINPPSTPYDKWNGERWVTDEAVKAAADITEAAATKAALIKSAAEKIEPLQDAVELDMATNEEKSSYDAWRKYRVLLTRVDTSLAPDISWPEPPKE